MVYEFRRRAIFPWVYRQNNPQLIDQSERAHWFGYYINNDKCESLTNLGSVVIGKVTDDHNHEYQHEKDWKIARMMRQLKTISEKLKRRPILTTLVQGIWDVIYQKRKIVFHHIPNTGKVFENAIKL